MGDQPRGSDIRALTPYLVVSDARAAIAFYQTAFGALELAIMEEPDGRVGHATLRLGPTELFVADEHPELEAIVGPGTLGGTSVILDLEVDDVDVAIQRAVAAGATLVRAPDHPDQGVQAGKVRDPFGHVWLVTRVIGD